MTQHSLLETIVLFAVGLYCIIDGIRRLAKSDYLLSPNQRIYIWVLRITGRKEQVDKVTERFYERNQRIKLGLWYIIAGLILILLYFFR